MLRRELISAAIAGTASRLGAGFAGDVTRRENRLRLAFADALAENAVVEEVRISPEWRPELPLWPWSGGGKKLGGFDVAIRFAGDDGYSLVAELKWSHYGIVNALDDALWDAFKLAHASATLAGVEDGVLVYLAPRKAWEKPARFAQFFGDSLESSRTLIENHDEIWRWSIATGSATRPTKLPPYIQTGPIAQAPLEIAAEPWEIRAAVVRANGEPWIDIDADGMPISEVTPVVFDWPYPEPGPGMVPDDPAAAFEWPTYEPEEIPSSELRASDVPAPNATWNEITWFAAGLNGYARFGDDAVGEMANAAVAHWRAHGTIDPSLDLDRLRGCLFFESRRYHHFGHAPGAEDTPYIRVLIEAIRGAVARRSG